MRYKDHLTNLCITELKHRVNDDKAEDKILTLYSNDSRRKDQRIDILNESIRNIKKILGD